MRNFTCWDGKESQELAETLEVLSETCDLKKMHEL
jgi:hypothetical protein